MKIPIQGFLLVAIFAVCGLFFASCGGGSGGGSSATTINGISVPPEPDATQNNATIAGVDSNANGVRDDVERKIAELSKTKSEFSDGLLIAKTYEKIFTSELSSGEVLAFEKSLLCDFKDAKEPNNLSLNEFYINTAERNKKYYQYIFRKRELKNLQDFEPLDSCK